MKVTKHVIVRGRVQGVGYRDAMQMQAGRLGVTGWVRNRKDGTVEAMVHGWADDVAKILNWARHGPAGSSVTGMDVNESSGSFEGFERRPSG
ncbi:MAG: acylphosphatase [Proteobacteria bacterium]|nr:MAG: acylphosphatase [Pseudomonadota bacterium]